MRIRITIQDISRLILLAAGIFIFAHAAIPHHHHYGFVHNQDTTECFSNSQDEQENNDEEPTSHCNAFNIITASNSNNNSIQNFTRAEDIDILFYFKPNPDLVLNKITGNKPIGDIIYPKSPFIYSDLSLRGPPSAA